VRINQRWFVWIILILCVAAIPAGLIETKQPSEAKDGDSESPDFFVNRMIKKDRIKVIRLEGMIIDKTDSSILPPKTGSASSCTRALRKAAKDEKIKAVLIRMNTPGGTVATSQEITDAVNAVKAAGKPVYVSMADLSASGGYYVAAAADKIYALPGSITGSIGVIMHLMNFKALGDKVGIADVVIKSGQFKDIASPYRAMTDEERSILQGMIADSYDQFVTSVAKGRRMKVEDVKKLADGRIYTGRQAKKNGLIDELGGYDDAMDALQAACIKKYGLKDELPVEDKADVGFLANLLESANGTNLFTQNHYRINSGFIAEDIVSDYFMNKLYKQPLWMLQ
jgi:protease IV